PGPGHQLPPPARHPRATGQAGGTDLPGLVHPRLRGRHAADHHPADRDARGGGTELPSDQERPGTAAAGQGRGQCEGTRHRRLSLATGLPHHGAAVTSSRPRSANSPAVATSVTAPATPANRTLALSSPATVRFTAQAQRVAGRSTGCRVISSPTP